MKQQLLAIAAAILSLAACTSDEDALSAYRNDPTAVRITAQVGTTTTDGFTTRSNPIDADKQTAFNQGDEISVSADGQSAVTYEYNGTEWTPQDGKYLKWENDKMQFKAFYPATFTGTITQPTSFASEADLAAADFMTFSGEQRNTNGNKLALTMERQMARVIIEIKGFNNQYSSNAAVESVTLCGNVVAYKNGKTFYALIKPGYTASADANFLTLFVKDGEVITTEKLATKPTFEASKSYTYQLTVGKNKLQIANVTVEDWGTGGVIADDKATCIGVTTEAQLRAAFQQGGNIKLGVDITLNEEGTAEGHELLYLDDSEKTINVDLNGHTLTHKTNTVFSVEKGTLTIKNGTLKTVTDAEPPLIIEGGTVTVEDCTLTANNQSILQSGNASSTLKNCILNGRVKVAAGSMTLIEGTQLNEGTVGNQQPYPKKGLWLTENARVVCDFEPASDCLYESKAIANGNNTWAVVPLITEEDALKTAFDNGWDIWLGADITLSSSLTLDDPNKIINIDLNSHKLTSRKTATFLNLYQGTLNIKNGTLQSYSAFGPISVQGGTLNVENSTLIGGENAIFQTKDAKTILKDCIFKGYVRSSTDGIINIIGTHQFENCESKDGSASGCKGIYVVNGGKVVCNFNPKNDMKSDYENIVNNNDGTWTVTAASN